MSVVPLKADIHQRGLHVSYVPIYGEASQECSTVLAAGGFEPVPVNAGTMPPQVLKALASKESGPPPPKLDAAALAALIASTRAEVPLPDRNPRR